MKHTPPCFATGPPPPALAEKGTGHPLISRGSFPHSLQAGISVQLWSLFWNHSTQTAPDVMCTPQFTSQAYKLQIPSTVLPDNRCQEKTGLRMRGSSRSCQDLSNLPSQALQCANTLVGHELTHGQFCWRTG